MDSNDGKISTNKFLDRIRKSWVPLAAVTGALTSFVAASFRVRPAPAGDARLPNKADASPPPKRTASPAQTAVELERAYTQTAVLGGSQSPHPYLRSLKDIAVGPEDTIYSLGDDEIRIYRSDGTFLRKWGVGTNAACLDVGAEGRVYVGTPGRLEIYDPQGNRMKGMEVGDAGSPAAVTAVKAFGKEILVADATARIIHRYSSEGKPLGVIGDKNKTGSFMLPNRWLDFDVDSGGIIHATDTGRHRVTWWMPDGSPAGYFGKFGMQHPADFVGCCNPVNLAVMPEGNIVTGEKMVARVKVYTSGGKLLAVIGPGNFHPDCTHIHLAVDSRNRILTGDPVHRVIKIFSRAIEKKN